MKDMNEAVKAEEKDLERIETTGRELAIANQENYLYAGEMLKEVKGIAKRYDELKKSFTRPIDEAKKNIMAFFRPHEDKLAAVEADIKKKMLAYTQKVEAERIAEQRRLDEIARKEREAMMKKAEKAEAKGNTDKADALFNTAQTIAAPVVESKRVDMGGIKYQTVWQFEVTDAKQVPREFLSVDEKKIRAYVTAMKESANIAGVKIYSEQRIAAGAR